MRKKTLHKKRKQARKHPTSFRFFYIAIAVFLFAVISFGPALSLRSGPQVLGASTSTHSSFFPFSNFFNSIFSFFSNKQQTPQQTASNDMMQQNQQTQTMTQSSHQATTATPQETLTQDQLLVMAGNMYADGNLPLGDNKYTTTNPQKGYIYLCNVPQSGGGGAQTSGSWLSTTTWTANNKPVVQGANSWPNAQFSDIVSGSTRTLMGNGLPVGTTTGTFPIASSDPAYQYDRNPNTITAQSLNLNLPANPTYSETPYCMGMEVGVMTNGVPLFNGFDAELRDAPAHEIQDSCDGHPQENGEYHYHGISSCLTSDEQTVIGFALDGFPITGPQVTDGKYLTTQNLDECHGITSQIVLDGKVVTMYHYVMTQDFPYSVGCFRGKPVSLQVIATQGNGQQKGKQTGGQGMHNGNGMQQGNTQTGMQGQHPTSPQAAITACSGQAMGASCSFSGQNGTITGTCQTPPGQTSAACVPANHSHMQGGRQTTTGQQSGQFPQQ